MVTRRSWGDCEEISKEVKAAVRVGGDGISSELRGFLFSLETPFSDSLRLGVGEQIKFGEISSRLISLLQDQK